MGLLNWFRRKKNKKSDVTVNNINFYQVNLHGDDKDVSTKKETLLITEKPYFDVGDETSPNQTNDWRFDQAGVIEDMEDGQSFDNGNDFEIYESEEDELSRQIQLLKKRVLIAAVACVIGSTALIGGGIGVWTHHKSVESQQSSGIVRSQPLAEGVGVVKVLSEDTTYVLNLATMKIHLPECSAVTEMAFDNLEESDVSDLQILVNQGYEACFRCMPQEKQR